MKETEVKFRVTSFKNIIPVLKKLRMQKVWQGIEKNFHFDTQDHALKKAGSSLRVREWSGHSNTVTLKTKPSRNDRKYKVRNEFQIVIDDTMIARNLLKNLGFIEYTRYQKYREHWKLGNVSIELDKLKGLYFVEIEGSKSEINRLAKILGLDWKQSTTEGYLTIIRRLQNKKANDMNGSKN